MKQVITLLCTLLLASGAATAAGQDHAGHGADAHPAAPAASEEFKQLDADKDAGLSREELAKHRLGPHFAMLDADRNGKVDAAEFAAGRAM